jgi:putative ATPase
MKNCKLNCGRVVVVVLAVALGALSAKAADESGAAKGDAYLLAEQPKDAADVGAVRKEAKDQEDVTVVGRIGGRVNPWIKGTAAFSIVDRALSDTQRGLGKMKLTLSTEGRDFIIQQSQGDCRVALNGLESAAALAQANQQNEISLVHLQEAFQKKPLQYDKAGDEHYNVISAFIKSMRGSDPDAALYWMMRMLEAGEEPLFIARRMVIFASEDIGNADPHALQVAVAAKDAVHFVGLPEGKIPLAQAVTYLASAPKSNASYKAMLAAAKDVGNGLHIHLAQRATETAAVQRVWGKRPAEWLEELGVFSQRVF